MLINEAVKFGGGVAAMALFGLRLKEMRFERLAEKHKTTVEQYVEQFQRDIDTLSLQIDFTYGADIAEFFARFLHLSKDAGVQTAKSDDSDFQSKFHSTIAHIIAYTLHERSNEQIEAMLNKRGEPFDITVSLAHPGIVEKRTMLEETYGFDFGPLVAKSRALIQVNAE